MRPKTVLKGKKRFLLDRTRRRVRKQKITPLHSEESTIFCSRERTSRNIRIERYRVCIEIKLDERKGGI